MSTPSSPQNAPADPKGPATGPSKPGGTPTPPKHTGPGAVKKTARTVKQIALVVIGAIVAIFAVTNTDPVRVNWVFGETGNTPLILVIAITLLAGLVIGWLFAKISSRGSD